MPCDVHGCWKTAKREMGLWIAQDVQYSPGVAVARVGLSGSMVALVGAESWTTSTASCLLIRDMDDEPLGAHADIAQAEAKAEGGMLDEDVQTGAAALGGNHNQEDCKVIFSFKSDFKYLVNASRKFGM